MNGSQEKWSANRAKVVYAKSFPGMLQEGSEAIGKVVSRIVPLSRVAGVDALLFDDRSFLLSPVGARLEPAVLLNALHELRPDLGEEYAEAFAELDRLTRLDVELTRQARLENILGAIRSNYPQIPELSQRIPELLRELESGSLPSCPTE